MPIVCPHCQTPVPPDMTTAEDMACATCGSTFRTGTSTTTAGWTREQRTLGKFDLLEEVGAGAFGSVYRAQDRELGRTVAVKIPRAGSIGSRGDADRFLREARSVAQLRHPSIVPVFEIGQDGGLPYLVSEFVHGITLADLLTGERLSPRAVADLVALIADALDYAHAQGVVHRDVKPSNIMLETRDDGQRSSTGKSGSSSTSASGASPYSPRVMDFGLAKRDAGEVTMTIEGQVLGTPAYMSPEQARGESHTVDGRSDVYSLGVILYQLLTGELPFKGNARMLMHQVLHDEPRPPRGLDPKVPRDLETVCLKAMAREPARRYQTAGEFAADLRRWLVHEPILARPVRLPERLWRRVRRNPAVYGLGAAVVVLLGIVIGIVTTQPKEVSPPLLPPAPPVVADTSADDLLKVVAELDRTEPGWRLDEMERKRPDYPDEENGATQIHRFQEAVAAMTGRPKSEGSWLRPELQEQFLALSSLPPDAPMSAADLKTFSEELARVESVVPIAREIIHYPQGRISVAHSRDAVSTLLPEHQAGRGVAHLLLLDALMQLQKGNPKQALDDGQAMWNIGRVYLDEPIPIAQLIRVAVIRMDLHLLERILAHGECSDADLAEFQQLIDEATRVPVFATMMRGERAMLHYFLSSLASGDVVDQQILEASGIKDRSQLPDSRDIRRIHAWQLAYATEAVRIAEQPPERWAALLKPYDEKAASAPLAGHPLVDMFIRDSFGNDKPSLTSSLAMSVTRHLAELRTALTALALERYRLAHGQWPDDLDALVPTYLQNVPIDPYDGQPVRYRRTADGVVVYCLGSDLADNQGKLDRLNMTTDGHNVGFQLWDANLRH